MKYRDVEYQVVHTPNRVSWKWTAQLGAGRSRTGGAVNRTMAIALAQRAIERALNPVTKAIANQENCSTQTLQSVDSSERNVRN